MWHCRSEIKTNISVKEDPDGAYTEVVIKTTDRPGLLTDIVTNMKDMNVNVVSAEASIYAFVPKPIVASCGKRCSQVH